MAPLKKNLFRVLNTSDYMPNTLFDAIVFNETLCYFDNPLRVLEKYKDYLGKEGVFITCMSDNSERAKSILRRIKVNFSVLDEVKIMNQNKAWTVSVLGTVGH